MRVAGWVRNTSDGRVEAVFEGWKEDVDGMIRWCRRGSPMARVEDVQVQWEDFQSEFDSFSIQR
jgi:acylphosphatase